MKTDSVRVGMLSVFYPRLAETPGTLNSVVFVGFSFVGFSIVRELSRGRGKLLADEAI
jgi:hypothetical protein